MNIVMETSATDSKQQLTQADKRSTYSAQSVEFGDALNDLVQRVVDMKAEHANAAEHTTNGSSENVSDSTARPSEASLRGERSYEADHGASGDESLSEVAPEGRDYDIGNLSQQDQLTLSMVKDGYKLSGTQTVYQLGNSHSLLSSGVPNSDAMTSGVNKSGEPLAPTFSDTSAAIFDRLSHDLTGVNSGAFNEQRISNLSASALQAQTSMDTAPHERPLTSAIQVAVSNAGSGESLTSRSSNVLPTVQVFASEPQTFASTMATHLRVIKNQGGGEAKINLHPAELGRMSISVSTEATDTKVSFVVETSQARQAVEAAMPRLKELLEQSGLSLADSDVTEQHKQSADDKRTDRTSSSRSLDSADTEMGESELTLSVALDPSRLLDAYA